MSQALSENEGLDAYLKDVAALVRGLVCDIAETHKGLFEPDRKLVNLRKLGYASYKEVA